MEPDRNVEWFHDNHQYQEHVARFALYRNARRTLERELAGSKSVLDIGNGGFFNYDVSPFDRVLGVDLFVPEEIELPSNVTMLAGDARSFAIDEAFDCVIMQNVIHHVTGDTASEAASNISAVISTAARHVNPHGKIVIIESVIPEWFYVPERLAFDLLQPFWRFEHPITLQHPPRVIMQSATAMGLKVLDCSFVPKGRWVLQYGIPWPTALTPVELMKLVLRPN